MKTKFTRISMTLPEELLKDFDKLVIQRKYFKRSEAIRDALRNFITENRWQHNPESKFLGALLFTYDHHIPGISDQLTSIQHKYNKNIKVTMHIHLNEHKCLEILAVEGTGKQLKELSDKLGHMKGIELSKLVLIKSG
ncbi:MAG: nickel-responsive transcriptional regulator NikR [Candidatus Odinarchaeia archaeon]